MTAVDARQAGEDKIEAPLGPAVLVLSEEDSEAFENALAEPVDHAALDDLFNRTPPWE